MAGFFSDLQFLLESGGFGLAYGTNLFKGPKAVIPNGDGPYVSMIRTGGIPVEMTHNLIDVPSYEKPGAQIVTRAKDYDVAETMAIALFRYLWPMNDLFIQGTWYRQINVHGSEPFDLPPDERGMPRLAFNLDVVKRTSPQTS